MKKWILASALLLIATLLHAQQIKLNWTDTSNNEDGFAVERKLDSDVYQESSKTSANIAEFVDTGVPGKKHTYRVRAFNSSGASDYSNEATIFYAAIWPVDLQSSSLGYDQAFIVVALSKPQSSSASLVLRIHDGDTLKEGEIWVNGQGPIIFPEVANSALNGKEADFTFSISPDWFKDGNNVLKFVRYQGKGFRVVSANVVFTVPLVAPTNLTATPVSP